MSLITSNLSKDSTSLFILNWEKHPDLQKFSSKTELSHSDFSIMSALDSMYVNCLNEKSPDIDTVIDKTTEALQARLEGSNLTCRLKDALNQTFPEYKRLVRGEIAQALKRQDAAQPEAKKSPIVENLIKHGIYTFSLPDSVIGEMKDLAAKYQLEMSSEREKNPGSVAPIGIPKYESLYRKATSALAKVGIPQAISTYLGDVVEPIYVALHHSIASESWWQGCYKESNSSEYYHLDFDYDLIKSIIYLTPVAASNGPFKYIESSKNWNYSRGWLAFYKTFERSLERHYGIRNPGDFYYRSRYRNSDFLKDLSYIPSIFAGMSHFGDDLPIGSQEWKLIQSNEITVLSGDVNGFVFDGSQLMHRGGMVTSGERLAIQVAYSKKPKFTTRKIYRDFRSFARAIVKGK